MSHPSHLEEKPPQRIPKPVFWLIPLALLGICAACFASIEIVNWYATRPNTGLPTTLCAGMVVTPRFQVGLTWETALSSRISPLVFSPLAGCMNVPAGWLPGYSQYWLLPP